MARLIRDAVDLDLVTTFTAVNGGASQAVDTTPPAVDNIAPRVGTITFTTTGQYTTGDTIGISVPITDTSDVTLATGTGGAPTLVLTVGTTEKTLTSSTSAGTITALAFSYTVVAGDTDTDGVVVKANSLTLPSGTTIRDTAGLDLVTTFTAVNGGASQTVDTTAPTVGTIAFTTTGPYKTGDTIGISVPITDASAVTLAGTGGSPTLTLVVGTTEKTLTTTTTAGTITALAFSYTVQAGDTDTDGVSIKANSLTLPSGTTVRDAVDLDLVTTHTAVAGGTSQAIDTTAPTVGTITFTTTGPYKAGDTITISVPIVGATRFSGSPTLVLTVGTTEKTLTATDVTASPLVFTYTVVAGDTDTDGVVIKADSLTVAADTIEDAAGNDLVTTFAAVNGGTWQAVDTTPPRTSGIGITSTGPYTLNSSIDITVTFNEPVRVVDDGNTRQVPTVTLKVADANREAAYHSNTANGLIFRYVIATTDANDADGVEVKKGSIALNGDSIQDTAGNPASDLQYPPIPPDTAHRVDLTLPTVNGVAITSHGYYKAEDTIVIEVTLNKPTTITGTQRIGLLLGQNDATPREVAVNAANTSATLTTAPLVFRYTVQAGDTDADGVQVKANSLQLLTGAIVDEFSNPLAPGFTSFTIPPGSNQIVDTTAPTPVITHQGGDAPVDSGSLTVTIDFGEPVTGFGQEDITATNSATVANFQTLSAAQYTAAIQPSVSGAITVSVDAGAATDLAGNSSNAATPLTLTPSVVDVPPASGGYFPPVIVDDLEPPLCEVDPDSVTSSQIVFNELLNAYDDKNDWIELKNVSEEAIALAEWEISIVKRDGENANQDVDIVAFPEYTLPAGDILLIVNTNPGETWLAGGINIETGEGKRGAQHLYLVAATLKLPETPYLLILRRARDKNGQPEAIEDVAGTYFRNSYQYNTQVWPLQDAQRPQTPALLTQGTVWRRAAVGKPGYLDEAWCISEYQAGLGYDRKADEVYSLGTPGYANDAIVGQSPVESLEQLAETPTFSEIMFTARGRIHSLPQWIEVYNPSHTETVDLDGWHLEIEARHAGTNRHDMITFQPLAILPNQTVLLVTSFGRNSGGFTDDQVYNLYEFHEKTFAQHQQWNTILSAEGFNLKLTDPAGTVMDQVGNLDGMSDTDDAPTWTLPRGETDTRTRTSILRRYQAGEALDGTAQTSWHRAAEVPLTAHTYYGWRTDIGTPGVTDHLEQIPTRQLSFSELMFITTKGGLRIPYRSG